MRNSACVKLCVCLTLMACSEKEPAAPVEPQHNCSTDAPLRLSVGESRNVNPHAGVCITLPANENFVLSAANTRLINEQSDVPSTLLTFRTWERSGSVLRTASIQASSSSVFNARPVQAAALDARVTPYSDNPPQYDERYATASIGDTLRFIEWEVPSPTTIANNTRLCAEARSALPSYKAIIAAVAGTTVVVVDTRIPRAALFLTAEARQWAHEAAAIADRIIPPTMRSVFGQSWQLPKGAGGRHFVMISEVPGATAYAWDGTPPGGNGSPRSMCANSSEMFTTRYDGDALQPGITRVGTFASNIVHEYAHNIDRIAHLKLPGGIGGPGFLGEAWAVVAQETAARFGSNQMVNAVHTAVGKDAPDYDAAALGLWGADSARGPWQRAGLYSAGPRFLLFVREQAGEYDVAHNKQPTLHERLYASYFNWGNRPGAVTAVAGALGLTPAELIDRFALASATAGLVREEDADRQGLPRFRSWNQAPRAQQEGPLNSSHPLRVRRGVSTTRTLKAVDGSYAAAYFIDDANRSMSIEITAVESTPMIVRVTRIQ